MKVLVSAASKHGSTMEMAEAIARVLDDAGLVAEVIPLEEVGALEGYDAVVLGSAVYVGRWLPAATNFVGEHAEQLRGRPTWLFSSGPIGSPEPMPKGQPEGIADLAEQIGARAHHIFSGKIDRRQLSFGEKVITSAVRAPEGDFRDWPVVESWARGIAGELLEVATRV
jgi:menaquinone-dependent protoporphyrinogen oxidase